jgi:uncharacterized RDD family membrane protein YckC
MVKALDFLEELRNGLTGKVDEGDIEEILKDYRDIFAEGVAEGKSEDVISEEIGSPALIVRNILDDYENTKNAKTETQNVLPLASLGKRYAAFILDLGISLIPLAVLNGGGLHKILLLTPFIPFQPLLFLYSYTTYEPSGGQIIINLLALAAFWLYGTLSMIWLKGTTVGMMVMNIKVVKRNGQKVTPGEIITRQFLGKVLLPSVTLGLSHVVSFLWSLFSNENNTVHDKIAGTAVIHGSAGNR